MLIKILLYGFKNAFLMTKQIFLRFYRVKFTPECLMSNLGPLKTVNTVENYIFSQKGMFWKYFPGLVIPESCTITNVTTSKFFIT